MAIGKTILCTTLSMWAIAACGDSGDNSSGGGDSPDANVAGCSLLGAGTADLSLNGSCDQSQLLGTILLEVQDEFSFLDGKVANAVLPGSVRQEEMAMGGCKLMRKRFPFCDPSCQSNEACAFSGECIAFPVRQNLGDICVAGLSESYVLTAESPGFHYFNTQISHPAFAGGERVELRSSGGRYGDIDLRGVGVTKMVASESQWNIAPDQDMSVSWATSSTNVHSSVKLAINIDQHGSSPLLLECVFPDSGNATIPSPLLKALLNSGISGFPVGKIERRSADSIAVEDGCIEFVVRSPQSVDVRVAGHTPCTRPEQCPSGQTCNLAMETCE